MASANSYDISKDFRFKQARKFLKEKNYDDSIDIFVSLLQSCEETYGGESPQAAAAWYEYGNVLLLKEEENPANGVLGNVEADPNGAVPEDDDVGEEDAPDEAAGNEEGEFEDEDEPEGDLQIAWEALDVARNILSKQDDAQKNILLSDVYMRLGDLNRFNDNIAGALEEYQSALAIRNLICEPYESALSDVHFSLAVAYLYNAAEEGQDAVMEKKKALVHYVRSRESIEKWLVAHQSASKVLEPHYTRAEVVEELPASSSNSSSSSSSTSAPVSSAETDFAAMKADKAELADMLQETIDALKIEIAEMGKGGGSSSNSSEGVTTIGFGQPAASSSSAGSSSSSAGASSSSSGSAATGKTVNVISTASSSTSTGTGTSTGFSSASSSSSASAAVAGPGAAEVTTLQVKRKKRPLDEDATSSTATAAPAAKQAHA